MVFEKMFVAVARDADGPLSVYFHTVNFDAGIRTYPGAGCAAGAFVGIGHVCEVIATVVDFVGL